MHRYLFAILFSLFIPVSVLASIDADLRYGSRGQGVIELQEFLIDNAFLSGSATGNFFSLTRTAVKKYQASVGLPLSGFVGPLTRARINSELQIQEEKEEVFVPNASSNRSDDLEKQLAELKKQLEQLIKNQQSVKTELQNSQVTIPTNATAPASGQGTGGGGATPAIPATPATPASSPQGTTTSAVPATPATPATPAVPPSVTTQPQTKIFSDNFNSYSPGSIVGLNGWKDYTGSGKNFTIQATTTFEDKGALYNNSLGDAVVTRSGNLITTGLQSVYVKTENRSSWRQYLDGNAQVRISNGEWGNGSDVIVAVSFKSDGNVACYDKPNGKYTNFATYNDNEWTLLEIQWQLTDKTARYRINNGSWTESCPIANVDKFIGFDNIGFDFVGGGGAVYFDTVD